MKALKATKLAVASFDNLPSKMKFSVKMYSYSFLGVTHAECIYIKKSFLYVCVSPAGIVKSNV